MGGAKGETVILDIRLCHIDETDVACDATIVPPVENQCRYVLDTSLVVHLHYQHVFTLFQQFRHIHIKRCEAAYMVACLLSIHIYVSLVVHCSKVEQCAAPCRLVPIERALKPYRTLIEEQPLVLRVPVARHHHCRCLVEVVFYQVFWSLRLCILEESPPRHVHAVVVVALLLYVNDIVPLSV